MPKKIKYTQQKTVAGLTGWIEQHHILSSVDAAFLCESSGDLLRALVKLHAGCRAHRCPLEDSGNSSKTVITCSSQSVQLTMVMKKQQQPNNVVVSFTPWH